MRSLELSLETKARSGERASAVCSTIGGEIRRLAELQPDHVAVVASGFAPLSYRELQKLIDEVRAALRRLALAGMLGSRSQCGMVRRLHWRSLQWPAPQ